MRSFGLPAIFLVMLLKEAGVPIPIPGDVIMLGAAARAADGEWNLGAVIAVLAIAMTAGGTAQYLLVRGPGRRALVQLGPRIGLTQIRLEKVSATLQRGGMPAVAAGLATPGLRAAVLAVSGLTGLPFRVVFPAIVAGDGVFLLAHVALGYAGGAGIHAVTRGSGSATGVVLLAALIAVAALGLACWLLVRWRGRKASDAPAITQAMGGWLEAACPLCVAAGALRVVD